MKEAGEAQGRAEPGGLWKRWDLETVPGFLTYRHNYLLGYCLAEMFTLSPFLKPSVMLHKGTPGCTVQVCVLRCCILEPEDA